MSIQQNASTTNASPTLDLIVIGGGINGAGIAADAAGTWFKRRFVRS